MLKLMIMGLIAFGIYKLVKAIKSEEPADLGILITELNQEAYRANKEKVYETISHHKQDGDINCWVDINFPQIKRELLSVGYSIRQINNNLYEVSWR